MPREVLTRAAAPPDAVLRYGPGEDHIADLRLPHAQAPQGAPLVIFLHGGFWRAAFDRSHTGPLGDALAATGFAVCAAEFRRTSQSGGGWPGTFDDVAAAVDRLPGLAAEAAGPGVVSAGPPVLAGHSAGGHLALWAAGRRRLPPDAPWWQAAATESGQREASASVTIRGVVALAAVSDLQACHAQGLGQGAVSELLGGGPGEQPGRYRLTDPAQLLPLGCAVRLVHGSEDDRVPAQMSRNFARLASSAGDDIRLEEAPGADHFDVIDPLSAAWPLVLNAFLALASPEGSSGA